MNDKVFLRDLTDVSLAIRGQASDSFFSIREPSRMEEITREKLLTPDNLEDEIYFLWLEEILSEGNVDSSAQAILSLFLLIHEKNISLRLKAENLLDHYLGAPIQTRNVKIQCLRQAFKLSSGAIRFDFSKFIGEKYLLELTSELLENFRHNDQALLIVTIKVLMKLDDSSGQWMMGKILQNEPSPKLQTTAIKYLFEHGHVFNTLPLTPYLKSAHPDVRAAMLFQLARSKNILHRWKLKKIMRQKLSTAEKRAILSGLQANASCRAWDQSLQLLNVDAFSDVYAYLLEVLGKMSLPAMEEVFARHFNSYVENQQFIFTSNLSNFTGRGKFHLAWKIFHATANHLIKSTALKELLSVDDTESIGLLKMQLAIPNQMECSYYWSILSNFRALNIKSVDALFQDGVLLQDMRDDFKCICLLSFMLINFEHMRKLNVSAEVIPMALKREDNVALLALEFCIRSKDPTHLLEVLEIKRSRNKKIIHELSEKYVGMLIESRLVEDTHWPQFLQQIWPFLYEYWGYFERSPSSLRFVGEYLLGLDSEHLYRGHFDKTMELIIRNFSVLDDPACHIVLLKMARTGGIPEVLARELSNQLLAMDLKLLSSENRATIIELYRGHAFGHGMELYQKFRRIPGFSIDNPGDFLGRQG